MSCDLPQSASTGTAIAGVANISHYLYKDLQVIIGAIKLTELLFVICITGLRKGEII
ncbi:hypothetical protein [Desulfosporosinus lacus]|uniref:hypothetical protein n=1 Tax=Desulfosporosinus lacus TaxID=329936 RepID=UPI001356449E|nr:hypothetical protein [Desulfosporosinus lacus]